MIALQCLICQLQKKSFINRWRTTIWILPRSRISGLISYIPMRNYMPDWNRGGITGSAPFTMPYDGWVSLRYIGAHWKEVSLYAGSRTITVGYGQARGDEYHSAMANTFICFGGTVITYSRGYQEGTRDPYSEWCEFVVQWCPFIGE